MEGCLSFSVPPFASVLMFVWCDRALAAGFNELMFQVVVSMKGDVESCSPRNVKPGALCWLGTGEGTARHLLNAGSV